MKRLLIPIFYLLFYHVSGQTIRKYSNEFMNIGVDASAMGMSNAVTASTNDVNSIYWNPAGLLDLEDMQGSLMHASYFANIAQYDYAAFAMPIDSESAWGAALIRFGVDDILNTTQLIDNQGNIDYNRISLFSAADYAGIFSYSRNLPVQGFRYGINAKVIRRIIGDFADSWGFGLDLGLQFQREDWKFGLMLRDITTTYNTWNINEEEFETIRNAIPGENQDLPETTEITLPKAQLGVSRKYIFNHDYFFLGSVNLNMQFTRTNDLISTNIVSVDPAVGFEFGYIDLVYLRAGVGNFQNVLEIDNSKSLSFQPNLGLGFKYKGVQVDYALTNIGSVGASLYSNIFSLKVDLDFLR